MWLDLYVMLMVVVLHNNQQKTAYPPALVMEVLSSINFPNVVFLFNAFANECAQLLSMFLFS